MLKFTVCARISNGKFNSRFAEYFFQPYSILVPFFRMDFTVQTRNILPAFSVCALMVCSIHSEHSIEYFRVPFFIIACKCENVQILLLSKHCHFTQKISKINGNINGNFVVHKRDVLG